MPGKGKKASECVTREATFDAFFTLFPGYDGELWMRALRQHRGPGAAGIVILMLGLVLAVGGIWLLAVGGSWYYAIAALGFLLTAVLLIRRRPASLWVYALVVLGSLAWALWEAGLDWWPLAARGDVIFLIGAFLLTPWVTRGLGPDVSPIRGAGLPLTAALVLVVIVGAASWFTDPHRIEGRAPAARADGERGAPESAPGEWHAYGGTGFGQRYSRSIRSRRRTSRAWRSPGPTTRATCAASRATRKRPHSR